MNATQVKERAIPFSGSMVRAILDGSKTQTRRVIPYELAYKIDKVDDDYFAVIPLGDEEGNHSDDHYEKIRCPPGEPGDALWVRETWQAVRSWQEYGYWCRDVLEGCEISDLDPKSTEICYRATDPEPDEISWRPSIHMPRWASRITLEIKSVRVERVQEITYDDAIAEGCPASCSRPKNAPAFVPNVLETNPLRIFTDLWDSINAKRGHGWDTNPWVWVIEFARIKP